MNKLLSVFAVLISVTGGTASAQTLYAATGSNGIAGSLYTINPATGAVVSTIGPLKIGSTTIGLTGLRFHPNTGTLYGVTSNDGNDSQTLVTINLSTAAATAVGGVGALAASVSDISFDNSGNLYGWGRLGKTNWFLGTISLTTGVFTSVGGPASTNQGGGALAFSPVNPFTLYLSINLADGVLRTVNKSTGVTTAGPTLTGAPNTSENGTMNAFAVDNSGTLFGSNSDTGNPAAVNLVTINTSTGAVTNKGVLPNDTDAIAFQASNPSSTPIPSTALLMITCLAFLMLYRFRSKLLPRRS